MAELGLRAYRFSVAWPRVQPHGRGPADQRGLDFYKRLVDRLLELGIEPWLTLYHWDLPQALEDQGGWPSRDVAERFADYAQLVYAALHDRVTHWTTLNEPWCTAFVGYGSGRHAPGRRDGALAVRAAHHLLLGHGLALQAMRAISPRGELGITLNLYPVHVASPSAADADAARRVDGLQNRLFLDPVLRGGYPDDVLRDLEPVTGLAHLRPGDEAVMATPIDLLGVNYYQRHVVAAASDRPHAASDPDFAGQFPGAEDVTGPTRRCHWPSPRTAPPSTTTPTPRATSTTPTGSASSTGTSAPPTRPSLRAWTCAATSCGRCWTTSSGRTATRAASASSTSTTRPSAASSRTALTGTARSSPAAASWTGRQARRRSFVRDPSDLLQKAGEP